MQKYENGLNRISASRLARISDALKTSINFLLGQDESAPVSDEDTLSISRLSTSGAVRLFKAFEQVKDYEARIALIKVVEQMARADAPPAKKKR